MPLITCFNLVSPVSVRLGLSGLDDHCRSLPSEIVVAFISSQYHSDCFPFLLQAVFF